ncbi:MAG: LPS export ABC transporter periplasmic protein LptC [Bacteroidia bacterium]|jgi:LPS export ABC transporter protein LptC|nr:LPS export ABC transporter periplasmic protein LptC [Bacteroidia bacterium]
MLVLFRCIVILTGALLFTSCTNDLRDVMALPKTQLSPNQIGDTVTMLYTDSARLKIMVAANRMLIFTENVSEPFTILPKGVFVTFFDERENISATLKANYGIRYENSKRMEVKYAVEVINSEGTKLETERLVWDENSKRIYTDAFVKITTATEIIMGKGMESNQDFSKYELKQVTGQIQLKNDE